MIRKILLSTAMLTVLAGPAFAADLPMRSSPPPMLSPVPVYNWTGLYVGGNVGYGWGSQNPLGLIAPQFSQNNAYSIGGGVIGATLGGQVQVNHVVLGLEGDGDWANISGAGTATLPIGDALALRARDTSMFTVRSRIGYAQDNWLFYGTGGVALLNGNARGTVLTGLNACGTINLPNCSGSQLRPGAALGLGVEYGFAANWSAKAEYIWTGAVAGASTETINLIRIGLNYRFGG